MVGLLLYRLTLANFVSSANLETGGIKRCWIYSDFSGADSLTSSGSASQAAASSQQSTQVRRIIQVKLNDLDEPMEEPLVRVVKASESYDMTYSDSDGEWCICEENGDGDTTYFTKFTDGIKDFAGEHGMDGGSSPPG